MIAATIVHSSPQRNGLVRLVKVRFTDSVTGKIWSSQHRALIADNDIAVALHRANIEQNNLIEKERERGWQDTVEHSQGTLLDRMLNPNYETSRNMAKYFLRKLFNTSRADDVIIGETFIEHMRSTYTVAQLAALVVLTQAQVRDFFTRMDKVLNHKADMKDFGSSSRDID